MPEFGIVKAKVCQVFISHQLLAEILEHLGCKELQKICKSWYNLSIFFKDLYYKPIIYPWVHHGNFPLSTPGEMLQAIEATSIRNHGDR